MMMMQLEILIITSFINIVMTADILNQDVSLKATGYYYTRGISEVPCMRSGHTTHKMNQYVPTYFHLSLIQCNHH
jgi:hypothetical protein